MEQDIQQWDSKLIIIDPQWNAVQPWRTDQKLHTSQWCTCDGRHTHCTEGAKTMDTHFKNEKTVLKL